MYNIDCVLVYYMYMYVLCAVDLHVCTSLPWVVMYACICHIPKESNLCSKGLAARSTSSLFHYPLQSVPWRSLPSVRPSLTLPRWALEQKTTSPFAGMPHLTMERPSHSMSWSGISVGGSGNRSTVTRPSNTSILIALHQGPTLSSDWEPIMN